MFPATSERVSDHTPASVNRRIREEAEERIARHAANPEGIAARLRELDEEWDVERALEMNASTLAFAGVALGALDRRWLLLPAAVAAFLFQHAVQGWCPPLPVLRRMGFRTQREIEAERFALKALRGDFVGAANAPRAAAEAAGV